MSYAIMFVLGAIAAFPYLFPQLWPLGWVSAAPLFWAASEKKAAYRHGLAYFSGYYGLIYHWFIYLYPMDFAGFDRLQSILVIAVCWIGMTILQGPFFALVVPIYRRLRTGCDWADALSAASLWVIFEWLQTQTWMGVPWARLAVTQYKFLPALQSSSLLGSLFVSFQMALTGSLAAIALHRLNGDVPQPVGNGSKANEPLVKTPEKRKAALCALLATTVFSANLAYGGAALAMYDDSGAKSVVAAVIQGNIPSGEKWKDGSVYKTLEIYSELTLEACEKYSPEIVLWPETAINVSLRGMGGLCEEISNLAKSTDAVILVGAFDDVVSESADEILSYNAILAFYPDGTIGDKPYYKRHLVPFGEYLPMPWFFKTFLPMLADMNLFQNDLTPGDAPNLIETKYGKLGGLVCFDSIYGELARESVKDGANLIVLSTNDSWYRDSAAVYQHNGHAVLRAIETGRYVVRAANTGVSSIISPTGEVLVELGPLIKGVAVHEVKMLESRTPYSFVGDGWICACAFFIAGLAIAKKFKKAKTQ
ncbi:MAG TPA: apolipoprotein N-acyltransferase [Bacillota bacterium]|nr:apolipoprotein N-acyltransferase [Clostridiales bacterium]HPT84851.1 apolipoprotein N-acyltransferase [Bacillota bacterium]